MRCMSCLFGVDQDRIIILKFNYIMVKPLKQAHFSALPTSWMTRRSEHGAPPACSDLDSVFRIPEKMGNLVLAADQTAFTYTKDYLAFGLPGFCLLGDGAIWGTDTVTYPISERIPVFPRLLSLIPGNNPRNLQRRHFLDILRRTVREEEAPPIRLGSRIAARFRGKGLDVELPEMHGTDAQAAHFEE